MYFHFYSGIFVNIDFIHVHVVKFINNLCMKKKEEQRNDSISFLFIICHVYSTKCFLFYLDLLLFFDLLHCLRVFFIFVSLCIFFHLMDSFVLSTFQFKILKLKCFVNLTNIPCLVCWDLLNSWKEIYPVCIFECFIGKEFFFSKMVSLSRLSEYLCLSRYKPIFMLSYFSSFLWSWNCYDFFFSKILFS
jgi:hypothetical protein